jgi:hypothetical protein
MSIGPSAATAFWIRHVAGDREALDAETLEMLDRLFELVALARGERHARAHLPERLGHLQPEAERPAGDERGPPREVEQGPDAHLSCRPSRSIVVLSALSVPVAQRA